MRIGTPGFVPARLTQIRAAQRIASMSDLAKVMRVMPSQVSRWEKGTSSPEPETLAQLARFFGVRREFFLRPILPRARPVFFRKQASAAKQDILFQDSQMDWLKEISSVAQHYVDLPQLDIPDLLGNLHYTQLRDEDIESLVKKLRSHWGLGYRPCIDMVGLLERIGCVVATIEMDTAKLDGLCGWAANDDRPHILLANDKMSLPRRQFDAAHELGHAVLHRNVTPAELEKDLKEIERQAHRFASALLLPEETYVVGLPHFSLSAMLASKERWRVSIKAQIQRLSDLGLINSDDKTMLYKMYSAKGWHSEEPLDREWQLPQPRLLRDALILIVESGTRSKDDLLGLEFAISAADVERLAGLPAGWFNVSDGQILNLRLRVGSPVNDELGEPAAVIPFDRKPSRP